MSFFWVYLWRLSWLMDWTLLFFFSMCVCRWLSKGKTSRGWAFWVQHKPITTCPLHTEKRTDRTRITPVLRSQTGFLFRPWAFREMPRDCLTQTSYTANQRCFSWVSCLGQIPNGNAAWGFLTIKYYLCFKCHSILLVLLLAVTGEQCKSRWTSGCTSFTGVTAALEVP